MDEVDLYVSQQERGRDSTKRVWGIKMNEAWTTYVACYSAVDKIDQALKEWHIFYQAWKWHHAPLRHGKAFFQAMASQLYRHLCEGTTREEWKLDKPMSSTEFRDVMLTQMCKYAARKHKYPGDDKLRTATKEPRRHRGKKALKRLERCLDIGDDGNL